MSGLCDGDGLRADLGMHLLPTRLDNNIGREVALPFDANTAQQAQTFVARVAMLDDDVVNRLVEHVMHCFGQRHDDFDELLLKHYRSALQLSQQCHLRWSRERRMLLGSLFSMEYSIEGAALFNPSLVAHPDQTGVPEGALRYVMSLRAVGEGHLSSTVFQTGMIHADGTFSLDPPGPFSAQTEVHPNQLYHRDLFTRKLWDMGLHGHQTHPVMDRLPERFSFDELLESIAWTQQVEHGALDPDAAGVMTWLARANYELQLDSADAINDLILYPRSENESRGIEDMRLVRFTEDDGSVRYFGTYTAYDGTRILPMVIETPDFRTITVNTLNGACAQNKGMALFPRRINGHYVMCSRIDGQRLFLMYSDLVHFWESAEVLAEPARPWELRIIGNCGSPIETEEGWLLITHGVGPMRRYCIGAMLLDLEDPFKVLGRLRDPLIEPSGDAREGYVPNVVYSCGSLTHNDTLYLPFAVSDMSTRVAALPLPRLLEQLLADGP
jgi:predicted GH43/DUF377 family glycosyl hydrolase